MPLLSIVIANYNYGRFLEAAIKSVLDQNRPEVELIVIDGGSTDNSVEIIKRYANGLPPKTRIEDLHSSTSTPNFNFSSNVKPPACAKATAGKQTSNVSSLSYWISEPDKGQSDAFNKGFAVAKGKYLTWLNADDLMPRGCLAKICAELAKHPDCEWFTGNFYRFEDKPQINTDLHGCGNQRLKYRVLECAWGPNYLPKFLQSRGQPVAVYGPTTFFTKALYDRMGGMKVEQNFMMDTDLWMRFIVAGVKQRRINCFCWAFRMHLDSKTAEYGDHKLAPEQRARFEAERRKSMAETGYRASRLNHRLIQLWRVFDGSLLKHWRLKRMFKTVRV